MSNSITNQTIQYIIFMVYYIILSLLIIVYYIHMLYNIITLIKIKKKKNHKKSQLISILYSQKSIANCSSGLLGIITRNALFFIFLQFRFLLSKKKKDWSEIIGWVGATKKDMREVGGATTSVVTQLQSKPYIFFQGEKKLKPFIFFQIIVKQLCVHHNFVNVTTDLSQ